MKNIISLFLFLSGLGFVYLGLYTCLIQSIIEMIKNPEVGVVIWSLIKIFFLSGISSFLGFALMLASFKIQK